MKLKDIFKRLDYIEQEGGTFGGISCAAGTSRLITTYMDKDCVMAYAIYHKAHACVAVKLRGSMMLLSIQNNKLSCYHGLNTIRIDNDYSVDDFTRKFSFIKDNGGDVLENDEVIATLAMRRMSR